MLPEQVVNDTVVANAAAADPEQRIARLERRLARERKARREAEEISELGMRKLWLANQELDARVAERTQTLAEALEQLELANSTRDRLLATLSHEIRTPLNGVMGMLELIEAHVSGDQGQQYVEAATESADRLHQLITRLLDLVELDSGKFQVSRSDVALRDLGEIIRERWQRRAMQSRHLLTVTVTDATAHIDERRVLQIVDELVQNALVHATPGAVRVEFAHSADLDAEDGVESDGSHFEVRVCDNGPGIDPEMVSELLDDFAMVDDSTARATQGLGLGLGISRRMADAMDGALLITPNGNGSTVALRVPGDPESTQQRQVR